MDITLSNRASNIKPSPTLAVSARAAQLKAEGANIIGLGVGEPDFNTPQHIAEAAIQALHDGHTRYTPVDGIPSLKTAVAKKLSRDNQLDYELNQILVSCGGKQSFFNLVMAYLNPGDEVVIPAPFWVSYPDMVTIADAVPVIVTTDESTRFKITADQLEQAITEKTRLVVLNSPSNPTGMAYTRAELERLGEVIKRHPNVLVATDDMYEHIFWGDEPFCNILMANPELYDRTVVLNGVSKAYAMTGWRIGYAAGPAPLIAAMKKIQSQSTSNPTSISQHAAQAALDGPQSCVSDMVEAFRARHDYVIERLNNIKGISCLEGDGTFYAFFNVKEAISNTDGVSNDVEFAEHLLQNAGVALVPGSAFGCEGYLRLSFAPSMDTLQDALNRIEECLS